MLAVSSELVSHSNSLITGKIQGETASCAVNWRTFGQLSAQKQHLTQKFPKGPNRELNPITGKYAISANSKRLGSKECPSEANPIVGYDGSQPNSCLRQNEEKVP